MQHQHKQKVQETKLTIEFLRERAVYKLSPDRPREWQWSETDAHHPLRREISEQEEPRGNKLTHSLAQHTTATTR
jgi:hypothetical protein